MTAGNAARLIASLAIAFAFAGSQAEASGTPSQPSMLKIRAVGEKPVARQATTRPKATQQKTSRPTKLKTLANAPRLQPTPAPAPMFDEDFDQVAYEEEASGEYVIEEQQYELIAQAEPTPQGNGNSVVDATLDCKIKNLRTIGELTDATEAASGMFPPECPAPHASPFVPRSWPETTFMWKASALCHKPLYFEDVQLERYGHSWGPGVQPVVSSAMFFATVPILPYKMGMDLPWECVYPLGYYRPGDCAPYMIPPVPISVRGAAAEAAAVTGGILLIP